MLPDLLYLVEITTLATDIGNGSSSIGAGLAMQRYNRKIMGLTTNLRVLGDMI